MGKHGLFYHSCVWVQHQKQPYTHNPVLLSHMPLVPFFLSKRSGPYSELNMPKLNTDRLHKSHPGPVSLLGLGVLPLCRLEIAGDPLIGFLSAKYSNRSSKILIKNIVWTAFRQPFKVYGSSHPTVHYQCMGLGRASETNGCVTALWGASACRCAPTCSLTLRPSLERCIKKLVTLTGQTRGDQQGWEKLLTLCPLCPSNFQTAAFKRVKLQLLNQVSCI